MRNSGIWTTVTSIDRHDYLNVHRWLLTYVDFGGVGPSALEPFVLAFFPQYKSSEAEGNFKIWYILY